MCRQRRFLTLTAHPAMKQLFASLCLISVPGIAWAQDRNGELVARADAIPFLWYESAPAEGVPSVSGGIGAAARMRTHTIGNEVLYEVSRAGVITATSVGGPERWRVAVAPFEGAPVLAGGDEIYIAGRTQNGWRIEKRRGADGTLVWTRSGHSPCDVQLGVQQNLVAVHLRSGAGDRLVVLGAHDGALLVERDLDPAITRVSRFPPATAARARRSGEVRCTGRRLPAECTFRAPGQPAIRYTSYAWRDCRMIASVRDAGDLIFAELCSAASGVQVHGVSLSSGALRWTTRPYGIGAIGHSMWSNQIAIAIDGPYVRVWGREGGSLGYVSTLDRATGRELATITAR